MGNRAFVVFEERGDKPDHGVYLHWNGGPESVLAFLQAMLDRGWTRMDYASARFCAVASEFFDSEGEDSGLSLGVMGFDPEKPENSDPGDNGIYYVSMPSEGFTVKHRRETYRMPYIDAVDPGERVKFQEMVNAIQRSRVGRTRETRDHLAKKTV